MYELAHETLTCDVCGGAFERKPTGPRPRHCSASCRARACTARAKRDGRHQQWRTASLERQRASKTEKTCPYCARAFLTARPGTQITCGAPKCKRAHHAVRMREHMKLRRERERVAPAAPFTAATVFERDRWVCGICGKPVDPELMHPDPGSASVDHVIPLSRGGKHTLANARCAHLRCNQRRGTK